MIFRVKNLALVAFLALLPAVARAAYDGAANFDDHVTFTVKGSSAALSNFPLLVRVSEAQLPGFRYARANKAELAFVNSSGDAIPYEVDTWNAAGESLIWVKTDIPTAGTTITMYWSLKGGGALPTGITSADVWSDYAGVWHFNEEITSEDAATTASKDSTANGLDATPASGADTLSQMVSRAGVFGNARVNASSSAGAAVGANRLLVGDNEALQLGGTFTFSGWINLDNYSGSPRIVSKAAADQTGWEVESNSDGRQKVRIRSNGSGEWFSNCQLFDTNSPKDYDNFAYLTVAYNNGTATVWGYCNGHLYTTGPSSLAAVTNNTYSLAFGGDHTGKATTIWGSYDEFRLRKAATTLPWLEAETNNYGQATYLDAKSGTSFMVPGIVTTNATVGVDYWLELPTMSTTSWVAGSVDASDISFGYGELRSGDAGTPYMVENKVSGDTSTSVAPADLADLPAGNYRLYFHSSGSAEAIEDAVVEFTISGGVDEMFNNRVTFTIKDPGSTAFDSFPLLLRLSEAELPGFKYVDVGASNSLAFVVGGGAAPLPYEVDTWDESGESLVWVRVPGIPVGGAKVTMYWSPKDGTPPYTPNKVWSDYAGVWHFNETVTSATAESTVAADATGNGNDAQPVRYSTTKGDCSVMVSTSGMVGNARINGVYGNGSNDYTWFKVPSFDNSQLGTSFAFSGWVRLDQASSNPRIVSTKTAQSATAEGWEVEIDGYRTGARVFGYGSTVGSGTISSSSLIGKGFDYITVVYNGTTASVYAHGATTGDYETEGLSIAAATSTTGLALGGNLNAARSLWGAFDEMRIRKTPVSAAQSAAEYANMTQPGAYRSATFGTSFVVPDAAVIGSVTNDYWLVEPTIAITEWLAGSKTASEIGFVPGELRSGTSMKYILVNTGDSSTNGVYEAVEDLDSALAGLGEGYYKIICTSAATKVDSVDIAVSVRFDAASTYLDHVTFTLNGIGTTPVTNYTMLLRLSEAQLPGFKYARTGGKDKIAFTDGDGNKLYYDVDVWNPFGESIIWVNIPEAVDGAKITFFWALADGKSAPYNDKSKAWPGYAGVWHMEDGKDASGNADTGTVHAEAVKRDDGVFGGAYGRTTGGKRGPIMTVPANDGINALSDGEFTVSGWVRLQHKPVNYAAIFSRKQMDWTGAWSLRFDYDDNTLEAWVDGNSGHSSTFDSSSKFGVGEWAHVTLVYTQTSSQIYVNGLPLSAKVARSYPPTMNPSFDFYIGGMQTDETTGDGANKVATLWGDMDEVRVSPSAFAAERIASEFVNFEFSDFLNAAEGDGVSFLVPSAVVRAGVTNDYWRVYPSISASYWEKGDDPASVTYTKGELRSGAAVTVVCETAAGAPVECDPFDSDALLALDAGAYRIRCYRTDKSGATVDDAIVYFTITKPSGVSSVGDSATGRILLMNNDWTAGGSAANPQISGQGWANTNFTATTDAPVGTFWEHLNDTAGADNVLAGTESRLLVTDGTLTNELWRLVNCRHGNTFPTTAVAVDSTADLLATQNYLPASAKSSSVANTTKLSTRRNGVGQLLMQNTTGAVVYSPCYTNGIGTIYFDAVNGWCNNIGNFKEPSGDSSNTNAYQFVVEISRESANVSSLDITDWSAVTCHVVRVTASTPPMTKVAATNSVALTIADGGSMNEFYRIYVPIEEREAVRFRIRRTAMDNKDSSDINNPDPDAAAYILIDNIVVSYPRMTATLHPAGVYFAKERKDVLGMEGAFVDGDGKSVLPAVGDTVFGKAVAEYYVNASTNLTETNFIASARMHYRWRYLNQIIGEWQTVSLDAEDGFKSTDALDLPGKVGDVEFWYEADLQLPYYKYVDYSGMNLAAEFMSIYTENVTHVANAASKAESFGYPSAGTNWFVRLREVPAKYEGINVMTRASGGSVCETNSMYLVSTNQWRGFVKTISEIEGGLDFRFEGVKLIADDDGAVTFVTNAWTASSEATNSIPASCGITPGDEWRTAMCDAKTGYLVFTFDERRETVTVCRGDWQDFNHWSSAVTNLFVGSSIDTNTTTDVTKEYGADIGDSTLWPISKATNDNWSENFDVDAGQVTEEVYPRDVPIAITNSQHGWTVENASWTFQKWACNFGNGVFGGKSAVQLEGRGKGKLSYVSDTDYPEGLEYMQFTTRVAQFNEFNNFAYYSKGTNTSTHSIYFPQDLQNYTFTTFSALTLDKANQNFDGDGSISLVAYYDPSYGAYEVRVSRGGDNGEKLRFVLLKWHATGGGMACTVLGTNNFENVSIDGLVRSENNIDNLCHFYVSVREYTTTANGIVTGTLIHAGVSRDPDSTNMSRTPGDMSGRAFDNCVYFDTTDTRLDHGTFGVLTRNCPGAFIKPVFFDSPITQIGTAAYGDYPNTANGRNRLDRYTNSAVTFDGDSTGNYPSLGGISYDEKEYRRNEYYKCWTLPPGRTEKYTDTSTVTTRETWGFTGVTNVTQTIAVQTTPHGGSSWTTITNITVNGFMSTTNTCYFYTHSPCDVRLQVGGGPNDPRVDVTVDDVMLAKWDGEWTPNYNSNTTLGYPTNYVYTSAWIVKDSDEVGQKAVRLQPARAKTDDTPVSLRSPVMNGAGVFHFDWRNADTANTVLKLQKYEYSTASIDGRLRYATEAGVNDSVYKWTDIATINITEASGGKTFFLNERYDGENSVVLRLVADPTVVATARAGTDPNYGSIEITDSYVWDLPPYDNRSWSGWNFRADGWRDSKDTMWANLSDYKSGLSGLLNNTIDADTLAEPTRADAYAGHMPYIQSPTFETNCIGSVEFRARLYDPEVDELAGYSALVTVYGAKKADIDAATSAPTNWVRLADIEVSGTVYEQKSAKFKSGDQYCVLRFCVRGVPGVSPADTDVTTPDENHNPPLRVAIDDICILERPIPSIRFRKGYARPFRNSDSIKDLKPVLDIATSAEQPILEETFGFQAEIEINDLDDEIITKDPSKPIRVYVAYYPYADTWGWQNWIGTTNETGKAVVAELVEAEGTNLVYRSSLDDSNSMCPAQFIGEDPSLYDAQRYRLVQYHLFATYYDKSGEFHGADDAHHLSNDEWSMPDWDWGFENPNAGSDFSAFTLLEKLAPRQAWINEVNFADGSSTLTSKTNQWIEIAMPSGEDMTYWSVRLYDSSAKVAVDRLLTFGYRAASNTVNNATDESGDYSFYVAKSPATTSLEASNVQATWNSSTIYGVLDQGMLYWEMPYGFELVRPSGVVEHSVVIQGCNEWEELAKTDPGYASIAADYSGTNLVERLKANVGGDWVWGEEDKYAFYGYTAGVTNNMGGVHEDWSSPLAPTPGKINVGQVIGDWLIEPNGDYYRIYSNIEGEHVSQLFGGQSGKRAVVTVSKGSSTNIVFTVDKWYKLVCAADPSDRTGLDEGYTTLGDGRREYTFNLNSVSNKITVTASAVASDEVDALIDSREAAYKPAIMKWLAEGKAGKDGVDFAKPNGPLVNAVYKGHDGSLSETIDLVGMYWLDLDPTLGGWELWGGMGAGGSMPVDTSTSPIFTTNRIYSATGITHTNIVVSAWLMITNTVTGGPAYPPYRLQGLNNEKSDEYTGNWTSVTFKVSMQLRAESLWRDLRYFVFDAASFSAATAAVPFTAYIEVTDPHSMESPAARWRWYNYDMTPWAKWKIDTDREPAGVSVLRQYNYLNE